MKQLAIFLAQFLCLAVTDYLYGLPGIAATSFIWSFILILVKADAQPVYSLISTTAILSLTICLLSVIENGKMIAEKTAALFGLPHYFLLILASMLFAVGLAASAGTIGLEIGRAIRNQRMP